MKGSPVRVRASASSLGLAFCASGPEQFWQRTELAGCVAPSRKDCDLSFREAAGHLLLDCNVFVGPAIL
jgi:hypothetical protein